MLSNPDGSEMVGKPPNVNGDWNIGSPVVLRSRGAAAGVDGVITTSKGRIASPISRLNVACTCLVFLGM